MSTAAVLPAWRDLPGPWETLFLGNGASINICSDFSYGRLFDQAQLSPAAEKMFADFDTTNFELVLERLWDGYRVLRALDGADTDERRIEDEYIGIREALFDAIGRTHIRHTEIPWATLLRIADVLLGYRKVYTTNYDLLPYWSLMAGERLGDFTDFFSRRQGDNLTFDLLTSTWWPERTQLLHLHGGLHLWRDDRTGMTGKWGRLDGGALLELEHRYASFPQRQPLLVSEGTAADKFGVIQRNAYLSFALRQLAVDDSDLVIFGSSFGPSDAHITDAINAGSARRIAISMRTQKRVTALRRRMAELEERFDGHEVHFFDATTHPLGNPDLRVR